jgi:hypothetical protein
VSSLGGLVAAGCGDDADSDSPSLTATSTTTGDATFEVVAVDYAFDDLPAEVPAGTALRMHNESSAELHEFIAYRLPDDETRSADELMALPEEELGALFAGEPDFGLVAPPGESSFPVIGDGTLTEPGRYLVFCAIPTGADPDEAMAAMQEAVQSQSGPPQIAGGPPHFMHGMYGELVVE